MRKFRGFRGPGRRLMRGLTLLGLAAGFVNPSAARGGGMICEFTGPTTTTISCTPFAFSSLGLLWDTYTRTCTYTRTGPAGWTSFVTIPTVSKNLGFQLGDDGSMKLTGGVTFGGQNVSVSTSSGVGVSTWTAPDSACFWNSTDATGANSTIPVSAYSNQQITNGFTNSVVTFDGVDLPYGASMALNQVALGSHVEHVVRTTGSTTDDLTFHLNVLPAYTMSFAGSATDPTPVATMHFTNLTPNPISVDFAATPRLTGLGATIYDNWRVVGGFASTDVSVDFSTLSGYVAAYGQTLSARIDARLGADDGPVLASDIATAMAPVPEPSTLVGAGLALLIGALRWSRRQASA